MPRRKKSTAKKPKGSKSGISINIKNIMRQVQNERPRNQDFINLSGKKPMDNLESGSMSRLQTPAMTYASRPLSQFPSLASLSNITREFAPPLSQLTSNSTQPLGAPPLVTPKDDRQNDVLERFRPSKKEVPSNPVVPTEYGPEYVPTSVFEGVTATGAVIDPRVVSGSLASYIGEPAEADASQALVAVAAASGPKQRGRPRLPPGEKGPYTRRLVSPTGIPLRGPSPEFKGSRILFED